MRRMLLVTVTFLVLASAALAQVPDSTYVGLFFDDARTIPSRVDYVITDPQIPTTFYTYIYFLPGVKGLYGADYSLKFPDNVTYTTITNYTGLFTMGDIVEGITVIWPDSCRTGWTWSQRVRCRLNDAVESQVEIGPRLDNSAFSISNCDLMDESYIVWTYLYLNKDGALRTESKSWGAIKSLYR
jgi:hypothetical protein